MTAERILVVGAGFAGATYARCLADAGYYVDVIDRRPHIGGNAYDYIDNNGVRVHKYGPHLFHTNIESVVKWIHRFGEWIEYRHKVKGILRSGDMVPIPVNKTTIEQVFNVKLSDESATKVFLDTIAVKSGSVSNAADYLHCNIGTVLTDLFFRPYTKKMWGLDLEELDASIVARIPIRLDTNDEYFPNDKYQYLPANGYEAIFKGILSSERIRIFTNTRFSIDMENDYSQVFNSMPIDEYFNFSEGRLPYRSIKFHHNDVSISADFNVSVVNFTDDSMYTRTTYWHNFPRGMSVDGLTVGTSTLEEPCDYRDNDFERYYPVKTSDQRHMDVYKRYLSMSNGKGKSIFVGRCGTYQYLDMHQVINQSLIGAKRWIDDRM